MRAALWRLVALDQRFVKLLNCTAEGFVPLAAATCYVDPSVSAVLGAPNRQGLFMTALAYIFQQCSGLSLDSTEPSSSQSTAASAAAGSSQTVEPAEPPLK